MAIPKKPATSKEEDDFIKGAKADRAAAPAAVTAPAGAKDKSFLLRIPYDLWDKARRLAGADAITLHDFIIQALDESVNRRR
jgi:predicted HicB family RNase H-like nuclease